MPNDFSKMSDEDLMNFINSNEDSVQTQTKSTQDFSQMSDEDLISYIQSNQPQEENRFLSNTPISESSSSPTNFMQDLISSFAANDEARVKYLQKEFAGSKIDIDPEQGILIDGLRFNPKGFDLGDIPRNAAEIFPFAGQILFSILGAGSGLLTSGTTSVPGMVAAGTFGATLGEGLKLAAAGMLGLDQDGSDVWNSLAEEASTAAIGEIAGAGVGSVVSKLGKAKFFRGLKDFWTKTSKKLGKSLTPKVAEFVGDIEQSYTSFAQQKGFSNVLNEKYFDPNSTSKIISKTLFGKSDISDIENIIPGTPIKKGTLNLIKSIKSLNDESFDNVVKFFSKGNLSDDAIDIIKTTNLEDIINPNNTSFRKPFEIANKLINSIKKHELYLGSQLEKATNKSLKSIGKESFELSSISKNINNLVKSLNITSGIKVKGYYSTIPPSVRGYEQLKDLVEIFKAVPSKNLAKELGLKEGQKVFLPKVSNKQASKMLRQFNIKADEIFINNKIPREIKNAVRLISSDFREKFYNRLNIADEVNNYKVLKNVLDDFNIDKQSALTSLESTIKNFSSRKVATQGSIDNILNVLPNGSSIKNSIKLQNTADELIKLDPYSIAKNMQSKLNTKSIIDLNRNNIDELLLMNLDDSLASKGIKSRLFLEDAQKSLVAKAFTAKTPSVLRVGAVANMLGLGAIGSGLGSQFGEGGKKVGATIGTLSGLALTNPRTIAKILVKMEKKSLNKMALKKSIKSSTSKKVEKEIPKAILRRLLTQKKQESRK